MAEILILDQDTHTYRNYQNRIIPGVSNIIKSAGLTDYSQVPQQFLEQAIQFGKAVHKACYLDDLGTLDEKSLSEALRPRLTNWRKFKKDYGAIRVFSEQLVYSKKWDYAGTLDWAGHLIIKDKAFFSLVDIKTPDTDHPVTAIQTAAYKMAFNEMAYGYDIKRRFTVKLLDDSYYVTEHKEQSDKDVFIACRQIYGFKERNMKFYGKH